MTPVMEDLAGAARCRPAGSEEILDEHHAPSSSAR
jgi:hypothetical protein